ncbi:hypothetical protein D3C80_1795130 [compost metagenome]
MGGIIVDKTILVMPASGTCRQYSALRVIENMSVSFVSVMPAGHVTSIIILMIKMGKLESIAFC